MTFLKKKQKKKFVQQKHILQIVIILYKNKYFDKKQYKTIITCFHQ